ncbi:tetratricopeptide repeat-containing sensor histidine kinase [Flavobacterium algicola]|uniref:tetratricopeptide repeat-containing sensor histidine kinase n=1 Tax=Flavobacterium algicola TaxID=556529 RepID=UPI001EFEAC20|nr:tetratricopeptide repeat-containing sensor histidine kinase [Flavobacterium algicola]MCG9791170.1 tetratricopeptide repeat protein [Flavobacterium algicola]
MFIKKLYTIFGESITMLRSPFLCLFIFVFFLSCQEERETTIKSTTTPKEITSYRKEGLAQLQKEKFNAAFYNFNKSKILSESIKDSANIVFNLIQMASIQQINGDYYGSKETITEALPYLKKEDIYAASINNIFGIAAKELFLYDDAIFYYNQAFKNTSDAITKAAPLNNIAVVYIKQNKYDKAIKILESILNTKNSAKLYQTTIARVTDNLGYAYFKKNDFDKSILLLKDGLALRDTIDDSYGSIESNLHLAEFYLKIDKREAIEHAEQAYKTATKFKSIDERLKSLSFLITVDFDLDYGQYAQQYIYLNDSITRVRNNFKNKFAKIKYDSKKEKNENQKLRLEKAENLLSMQRAEFQKILFLIGFVLLLVVIVYLQKNHRNKTKLLKIKTAYDTETRISKDIHDELANDVFQAITFAQTQSLTSEKVKESLIEKLDTIYNRVRRISRENSEIHTGANYAKNFKEVIATYSDSSRNVIVNNIEKVNWEQLDDIKKVTIYRILQELMVNMKKHSEATLIVVKFDISDAKSLIIYYSDNGKGCAMEEISKNGIQNTENRILAINGSINFDTAPNKGFKVKITVPN